MTNETDKDSLPELPSWVDFPPAPPAYRIVSTDSGYTIEGLGGTFLLPSEAYDYIQDTLKAEAYFEPNELSGHGSGSHGMFFENSTNDDGHGGRILISHTREDTIKSLKEDYQEFLALTEVYEANPDDWFNAFQWIRLHPAFWHRHEENTDNWNFEGGWDDKAESIWKDDDGRICIMFEHGPYINSHVQHTVDQSLTVWAEAFEDTYIAFAKKIYDRYLLDGTENPDAVISDSHNGKSWNSHTIAEDLI